MAISLSRLLVIVLLVTLFVILAIGLLTILIITWNPRIDVLVSYLAFFVLLILVLRRKGRDVRNAWLLAPLALLLWIDIRLRARVSNCPIWWPKIQDCLCFGARREVFRQSDADLIIANQYPATPLYVDTNATPALPVDCDVVDWPFAWIFAAFGRADIAYNNDAYMTWVIQLVICGLLVWAIIAVVMQKKCSPSVWWLACMLTVLLLIVGMSLVGRAYIVHVRTIYYDSVKTVYGDAVVVGSISPLVLFFASTIDLVRPMPTWTLGRYEALFTFSFVLLIWRLMSPVVSDYAWFKHRVGRLFLIFLWLCIVGLSLAWLVDITTLVLALYFIVYPDPLSYYDTIAMQRINTARDLRRNEIEREQQSLVQRKRR